MVFTENTRLQEICQAEHLLPIRDCLISGGRFFEENGLLTLAQLQERFPGKTPEKISALVGMIDDPGKQEHTRSAPYMAVKTPAWPP